MVPTLMPGATVTAYWRVRRLRDGDVMVLRNPQQRKLWIVKRCQLVGRRRVRLIGDNHEFSTDSRHFGDVPRRSIRWVVPASSLEQRL